MNYLMGKTIAVVGNARTLVNKGKEIDSHDVVIRFNDFKITGYEERVGTKTNIWCHAFLGLTREDDFDYQWFPVPAKEAKVKDGELHGKNKVYTPNRAPLYLTDTATYIETSARNLTSGLRVLKWLHINGYFFDFYGFDGLKSPNYYSIENDDLSKSVTLEKIGFHNWATEEKALEEINVNKNMTVKSKSQKFNNQFPITNDIEEIEDNNLILETEEEIDFVRLRFMVAKARSGKIIELSTGKLGPATLLKKQTTVKQNRAIATEREFIDYLLGKTIAVVGNGDCFTKQGNEIDKHDVVIRFNNYKTKGYEQQVGTKTSIWANCCSMEVNPRESEIYDFEWIANHMELIKPDAKKLSDNKLFVSSEEFTNNVLQHIHRPTTGLAVLHWLYSKGFQYNQYGFDGLNTTHYFDNQKHLWHPKEHNQLKKLEMLKVVEAIIPYRDEQSRRETFAFVASWAARQFSKVHIICVNRSETLNKSKLFNTGIKNVDSKSLIALIDADMFATDETVRKAIAMARTSKGITYPYTDIIRMTRISTKSFLQTKSLDSCEGTMMSHTPGGYMFMPANSIIEVGGFDERYVEWGGEDDAIRAAIHYGIGKEDQRVPDTIYHLWHKENPIKRRQNMEPIQQYEGANIKDIAEIVSNYSDDRITEQIKTCANKRSEFSNSSLLLEPIEKIQKLIEKYGCTTCLDYGCGTGEIYNDAFLQKLGISKISLYDPAVPEHVVLTKDKADIVICCNVLHHIPFRGLHEALTAIFDRAEKVVYIAIKNNFEQEILDNGFLFPATLRGHNWWKKLIKHYTPPRVKVAISFNEIGPFHILDKE